MLLMIFSQISSTVDEDGEFLGIDPVEKIQYVSNSDPMSTMQDAVQFNGEISSSISGYNDFDYSGDYSEQWNESIATGVGAGDGNNWWKTPTMGSQFTVNLSIDDLPLHPDPNASDIELMYGAFVNMKVVTNSGSCGWASASYQNNISMTCNTPESGGMAYIRISLLWEGDMVEVLFNYTLEVAEVPPQIEIEHFCDDWPFANPGLCDSGGNTYGIPMMEGVTTSGTIEGWWGGMS